MTGSNKLYMLIEWPFSQVYMNEEWFQNEAVLYTAGEGQEHKDAAYFIPVDRVRDNS